MATNKAMSKAIDEELLRLRTKLDQLLPKVDEEAFHVTRQTTEEGLDILTSLQILEDEAAKLGNNRLVGSVRKERDRARQALGFSPRKRRRRR